MSYLITFRWVFVDKKYICPNLSKANIFSNILLGNLSKPVWLYNPFLSFFSEEEIVENSVIFPESNINNMAGYGNPEISLGSAL